MHANFTPHRLAALLLASAGCFFLTHCGGTALRQDFRGYSGAYGDMVNHQMLLNLARADQGHPTYFLAIGEIRSDRSMVTGANAGGSQTRTDSSSLDSTLTETASRSTTSSTAVSTVKSLVRGGTNLVRDAVTEVTGINAGGSVSSTESPKFQFIPMNSEQTARQLLEPIPPEVFYTLFQQGWPIDQLMRVLVERVEVQLKNGEVLVLTNSPTRGTSESFARFLRLCEMLRIFQRSGALTLETARHFSKAADGAFSPPKPKDLVQSAEMKWKWKETKPGKWQVGRDSEVPTFALLKENRTKALRALEADGSITDMEAVENFIELFDAGVTIRTGADREKGGALPAGSRLIMRSYSRVMDAVGSEQNAMDEFLAGNVSDVGIIPPRQRRPVLRTQWPAGSRLKGSLVSLTYNGQRYEIADESGSALDAASSWNRDVFRLVTQLASQVAVDISKFKRQVLELE